MKITTAILGIVFYLSIGIAYGQDFRDQRYEYSQPQMGTTFKLVFYATNDELAATASAAAFRKIDALNFIFSNYVPDSEINRIIDNDKVGDPQSVSEDLWQVLLLCEELWKSSDGAFDITIGPLSKLWRKAIRRGEFPSEEDISAAKTLVDFSNIKLDKIARSVTFLKPNMLLDFGGIAKGYAIDKAYQELINKGIKYALVEGGGDIFAGRKNRDFGGWTVKVHNVSKEIHVTGCGMAVSGSTYQKLNFDGDDYGHIVGPKSGLGVKNTGSVGVIAPSCALADGLATALSLMPKAKGQALIKKYKDCKIISNTSFSG